MKKGLITLLLFFVSISSFAQYEIRHHITAGISYSNLFAWNKDTFELAANEFVHEHAVSNPNIKQNYRKNDLAFKSVGKMNGFIGYRMTMDFNKRFSLDFGATLIRKSYDTEVNREIYNYDTHRDMYRLIPEFWFPSKQLMDYDEGFEAYFLEFPVKYKQNINSIISLYGGVTFGVLMYSNNKNKVLGVNRIDRTVSEGKTSYVIYQYNTNLATDISSSVGIDFNFYDNVAVFLQLDYGLMSIDNHRDSRIKFVGLRLGTAITFAKVH
ncbi:MAG: outer membrane beta-barrel protein [Flavobacteriales bacterium]|jgi:hypothetical protein|nr:outer membrane beta-barrel protein [Flavobacteriales bacterium]